MRFFGGNNILELEREILDERTGSSLSVTKLAQLDVALVLAKIVFL
jgi:hypothetical protein